MNLAAAFQNNKYRYKLSHIIGVTTNGTELAQNFQFICTAPGMNWRIMSRLDCGEIADAATIGWR